MFNVQIRNELLNQWETLYTFKTYDLAQAAANRENVTNGNRCRINTHGVKVYPTMGRLYR